MNTSFIDTNLFIRYLTNDDPAKADRVEGLLREAAAGKIRLVTTEMVMAEIVWVLESFYEMKKSQIAPLVRAILATSGVDVINAPLVSVALDHYETKGVDFIDGYIAAVMVKQGITELYSFDRKHISRLVEISRKEP